jgi:DNA sulfur modification protein DndD
VIRSLILPFTISYPRSKFKSMIFTELVIHNFGIYRGRHSVDLKPSSREKPIVLFGGLNGGGKTTFLDAMKLVLYGKMADCSNRSNLPYDTFLEETINRYSNPKEGAAIELEFVVTREGVESTYRVKRFWKKNAKTLTENVEVIQDNALDPVLSSHWGQYVDDFIPQEISNLFFFDGEKIESLADPESSANILKTGVYSLLGLNLIDRLDGDLTELTKRRLKNNTKSPIAGQLSSLDADLSALHRKREALAAKKSQTQNQLDERDRELDKVKKVLAENGGDFVENRERNMDTLTRLASDVTEREKELRNIASGLSPLSLVTDLLAGAKKQALLETRTESNSNFADELEKRDSLLLSKIEDADADILKTVRNFFDDDLSARRTNVIGKNYIEVNPSIFDLFTEDFFGELRDSTASKLLLLGQIKEEKTIVEQILAATPANETILPLKESLEKHEREAAKLAARMDVCEEELQQISASIDQNTGKQQSMNLELIESEFKNTKTQLVTDRSIKVSKTLKAYKIRILKKHLGQLENLIFESFISLARKEKLITAVQIEPTTFQITLLDDQRNSMPTSRLSAGERQLFAVSILWGLARASGRPLPAIVDTPLGRLDSKHRTHLVENYFPVASHQVILLSTDEEIDKRYKSKLDKYIGKEYHIQFIPEEQTSTITPGYF